MGACTSVGHLAIVSEFLPNGNLDTALRNDKLNLSLYRRMVFARDAALGINWLHCSNPQIIHRDLKPSNLLLDANNVVKVCDFGLSDANYGQYIVDRDSIPGSPLWMAPEVMLGKPLNEKSDVYSFAICLWEIVTRKEPFPPEVKTSIRTFRDAVCHLKVRPAIPPEIHPNLRELIEKCWEDEPMKRPSFGEIFKALENIMVDVAVSDPLGNDMWKKKFSW